MNIEFTGERMIPGQVDHSTFWEHVYRYRFVLPYIKKKRVLDIACGEGYGSAAMLKAGARSVVGIDISHDACLSAKTKYGLDARVGNALEIPLPQHSVDVLISFETIEHLSDPEKFLKECRRVLVPKGKLIISTPNKLVYRKGLEPNDFHLSELSPDEFFTLIQKYFSHVEKYSQLPSVVPWMSIRPLSSNKSPWLKMRGMYRLRKSIIKNTCPQTIKGGYFNQDAVNQILKKDKLLSFLVNPYRVSKELWNESPVYIIALANN